MPGVFSELYFAGLSWCSPNAFRHYLCRKCMLMLTRFFREIYERAGIDSEMAGQVDSLAGIVHGLVADEIIHKMKVYRGDPAQPQKPAPSPPPI